MADKAYITPNVLKWARESARMSEEIASAKVSVSVDKLKEWEEGISQPSIRQADILAKAYRRPFALLFLPEVPKDFQPLQDFRQKGSKELGTASVFIIREIQQKQAWIRDVFEENGEEKLSFVGKYTINDNPEIVAKNILNTLDINPAAYSTENPIKEWIDKAESKGIFISRTSFIHSRLTLDSEEIQGFAIADAYAPFVFINSDDWNAPQLFTLVHELAHIWIAQSGVSNDIEFDIINRDNKNPIEVFCNNVAANALMPSQIFSNLDISIYKSFNRIFNTSNSFGISSFALLVRALNLNIISFDRYILLKNEADIAFKKFLEREREKELKSKTPGGPNPYLLMLNKNSRLFTQIVIDAFRGGHIEPTQASSLLNAPVNKFSSFEAILYR
ncbi:MAG: XRE family transcriptional regulator [Bacteroidales bacterium]|jgi:Zn-dependent peptidase ImmA (M78 family)